MKRFLLTFLAVMAAVMLLTSGLNATLERMDRAPLENTFVCYNNKGEAVLTFTGLQALIQKFPRPLRPAASSLYHRTATAVAFSPDSASDSSRAF
jgi:hypothetical protein